MAIHRNPIPVERILVKAKTGVLVPDQARGGYFSTETAVSTPLDRYVRRRIADGSLIVCAAALPAGLTRRTPRRNRRQGVRQGG